MCQHNQLFKAENMNDRVCLGVGCTYIYVLAELLIYKRTYAISDRDARQASAQGIV